MADRTAFAPPAPTTQPDGDVRPASATEPARDQWTDDVDHPRGISPTEIALEAYASYVERGRVDGHDVEDWLAAERRLLRRATEERRREDPDR